ncbi:hypothetical protein E5Q_01790 [Mixia osmundae IAM 14324]|uniref:Elongation factor 1-gamma n=1 Tax=Mixia osmundae (strain CBS 9802 / IAM 14324 / JCM 22182 / KY 12970) TaxID=764103 RepID=G7DX38_MIXOS|nr:hypothetical protein E5Q_01790 [Mixia osmundae IAM 14324]
MSFGKLYGFAENARTRMCLIAAKYSGVELELIPTNPFKGEYPEEFKAQSPTLRLPGFEKDGNFFFEVTAVASYIAAASGDKANLLGKTLEEKTVVRQWASFLNSELLTMLGNWYRPYLKLVPYNKKVADDSEAGARRCLDIVNKALHKSTFLASERITLADVMLAVIIARASEVILDPKTRAEFPNVYRHLHTLANQDVLKEFYPSLTLLSGPAQLPKEDKPKKEKAPAVAAVKKEKAPKKAAKEEEDEDDGPLAPPEPKAKHPCEALGPAKCFPLDELKRQYSNLETPDALKWFEEHFDPQEYSLWHAVYKYPEELTQVFMSANLIGGFHNRLEGSRKYLFGNASVYGENNKSAIQGVYLIRGAKHEDVFNVAPDWESYDFKPLDIKADKDLIHNAWKWEGEMDGKPIADSKTFK